MPLTRTGFQAARSAILELGRPLDRASFRYHFEDGTVAAVVEELSRFQNDDGGFGNALEPDFRMAASSPLATSVGLQYAVDLDLSADEPLVRRGIGYLVETYRSESGYWPPTFEAVNDAPHAIWWHVDEVEPPTEAAWPNPSAELVGYLWTYHRHVPDTFLQKATQRARRNLSSTELVGDDDGRRYAILCWERALPHLPVSMRRDVRAALERTVRSMELESALHELYRFSFAFSPDTTVARLFPDLVDEWLEADIERQSDMGGWWPTWDWGQYPDVWPIAEKEWVGKLTLECLLTLDRFDKIDETT